MEPLSPEDSAGATQSVADDEQRVYLVPYRWWKEAQNALTSTSASDLCGDKGILYSASPSSSYAGPMKLINNIFGSDLLFNLRREEVNSNDNASSGEVGVSGRDYALVSGEMWLQALKWHSDSKNAMKRIGSFSVGSVDISDVYPLQLRLSVLREANSLGVKISKKDNAAELFRRACKIFNTEADLLHIWDFSGRTSLFFANDNSSPAKDILRQLDQEILLELQIYGLSDSPRSRDGKREEFSELATVASSSSSASTTMNGSTGNSYRFPRTNSYTFSSSPAESGSLGLTGLQNLGNTCFMNSALQCLAHTPRLVDYFHGDYNKEINHDNPLGMDGEIALAFGDLIRRLWAPGATPVAPRTFKSKLSRFAPQFSGFNQHDSQELLSFLLDGLHEDLNRVKLKPYVEAKDGDGRSDEDVADEYWRNHLARNDSIIVDICQGQYRSTLVCPVCKKVSVTFDPFMYLSLPLPSTTMRTMTLTVMNTDCSSMPTVVTVSVPKYGRGEDLVKALTTACSLRIDETLLVAEIYNHRIIRFLEDSADSLSLIRDEDRLVAYRLPKATEKESIVVFTHQEMEKHNVHGKAFGIPLVARISDNINGSDIYNLFKKLLNPFLMPSEDDLDDQDASKSTAAENLVENNTDPITTTESSDAKLTNDEEVSLAADSEFEFYLTDDKETLKNSKIEMVDPVTSEDLPKRLNVAVFWPEKKTEIYDTVLLSTLPEIFKSGYLAKRPQEIVSLYRCLEAFLKEEPLGPEDMWYCPGCKQHRQASKKLDLWRLPEILVSHLKRFSYSKYTKNKLEAYVDFPVDDLDLSMYIANKNSQPSFRYVLYAISNHYGSLGGGHYTAFVHHGGGRWYDFDDSNVYPISEEKIKTSAAYVLFYRRVADI
ncbi:ubiquitin carboxyl-terminal hydrolase 8-like [Chenopodium quinoa]|uniref:Ubiquitin carboxyl-terminal hydrolase n=1 Tax=Chenopodium quinoa TaxID=63459 RepID=A0A803KRB6_CHEQI|nr:ubiquitin carboxyl-terminal hydrolase 8-like [Chenopodium quinoa]